MTQILSGPEFAAKWSTISRHRPAPASSQAYVFAGSWVVDCCYPDCYNAMQVDIGATRYHCITCQHIAAVEWPSDAEAISAVLEMRPVPSTRNWAPAGHRQAIACGFPEGQSVSDLIEENEAHS